MHDSPSRPHSLTALCRLKASTVTHIVITTRHTYYTRNYHPHVITTRNMCELSIPLWFGCTLLNVQSSVAMQSTPAHAC